jgi:nucleolar protein TMA23
VREVRRRKSEGPERLLKRALKAQEAVEDGPDTVEVEDQSVKEPETKEQRKERKRLKKLAREAEEKDFEGGI